MPDRRMKLRIIRNVHIQLHAEIGLPQTLIEL
jgi:hypothetical protein